MIYFFLSLSLHIQLILIDYYSFILLFVVMQSALFSCSFSLFLFSLFSLLNSRFIFFIEKRKLVGKNIRFFFFRNLDRESRESISLSDRIDKQSERKLLFSSIPFYSLFFQSLFLYHFIILLFANS